MSTGTTYDYYHVIPHKVVTDEMQLDDGIVLLSNAASDGTFFPNSSHISYNTPLIRLI
jgi:hypothetical protein